MKRFIFVLALGVLAHSAQALTNVGEKPRNYCWKDVQDKTVCLEDAALQNKVRVLLYNGGFCAPCNQEFRELPKATAQFKGKNVVFISLSAAGWSNPSQPTKKFLGEWESTHGLNKMAATFITAASPFDAGRDFFADPRIPSVVVIDVTGEVSYKAIMPGVAAIAAEVNKVLPRVVPIPVK